jgi:hypothetical protein
MSTLNGTRYVIGLLTIGGIILLILALERPKIEAHHVMYRYYMSNYFECMKQKDLDGMNRWWTLAHQD